MYFPSQPLISWRAVREYRQKKMRKSFRWVSFTYYIPVLYGSTPYLLKNETVVQLSVKVGIILTCKPKYKGLFRSRRACKHNRTTQCKLANVKPRFFHFIYHVFISIAHSCEISLRQLVATFNRLNKPVWKYVKRSWALHVLFLFFILPLHVLTLHFFFVTGNFQTWLGDNYFSREQFFDTVSYYWLTLS